MKIVYEFVGPRPFDHQMATLKRILVDRGVHAMLHEPGTGKSRTVVDYCGILATGLGEVRVLIVAPKDVQDTWLTQLQAYLHPSVGCWAEVIEGTIAQKAARLVFMRHGIVEELPKTHWVRPTEGSEPFLIVAVTNIDAFASKHPAKDEQGRPLKTVTVADRLVQAVAAYEPHLLVLDESHRVRGPQGNAAKCLAKIAEKVPRRLLLTGTPIPHSPLDVWSQWRILAPGTFDSSFTRFKYSYAKLGGWMGREVIGFRNLDRLQAALAQHSSVVRKEDALDLPPTMDVLHPVALTPAESKAYAAMRDDLVARMDGGGLTSADNRLVQLLRLRQITSGYLKNDGGQIVDLGPGKRAVCLDLLEDLLASENRLVVFAWGRHEVDQLYAELARSSKRLFGARPMLINGDTPQTTRVQLRREFGSDDPQRMVLVAQIRTMSLGINELVTASHAVYLSQSQDRSDYEQSRARLDRSGQLRSVTFHQLVVLGTVDEVILRSHQQRFDLEHALLEHVRGAR